MPDESSGQRPPPEPSDPFDEATRSMEMPTERSEPDGPPDDGAAHADTTTFSGAEAPPVLIEAEETVVAEPDPEPEETVVAEPDPEPELESDPELDLGPDHELTAPLLDEPQALEDPPGLEPSGTLDETPSLDESPTVLDTPSLDESPTVLDTPEPRSDTASPVAPSAFLHPMLLERIEPSLGRGERLRLDGAHWRVSLGRAENSDVRLYTASASREHAVIEGNAEGEWMLIPAEGKSVLVDGAPTSEPLPLEVGMNLILGGDHLRCVTEGLDRDQMAAQTAAEGWAETAAGWQLRLARVPVAWWLIGGAALIGLALIGLAAR